MLDDSERVGRKLSNIEAARLVFLHLPIEVISGKIYLAVRLLYSI
jgi:hypothetical protein